MIAAAVLRPDTRRFSEVDSGPATGMSVGRIEWAARTFRRCRRRAGSALRNMGGGETSTPRPVRYNCRLGDIRGNENNSG